jgi:hypothetical protein
MLNGSPLLVLIQNFVKLYISNEKNVFTKAKKNGCFHFFKGKFAQTQTSSMMYRVQMMKDEGMNPPRQKSLHKVDKKKSFPLDLYHESAVNEKHLNR